jgi:Lipopolysaccharide-assembly
LSSVKLQLRWLCFVLLTFSCHYRMGMPASLHAGDEGVFVSPTQNVSGEMQVEAPMTAALRRAFFDSGQLGRDESPWHLESKLLTLSSAPLVASEGRLPNYRLTASIEVVLTERGEERNRAVVDAAEDFPAGADALFSETNRSLAIDRVTERLAQLALRQLATARGAP